MAFLEQGRAVQAKGGIHGNASTTPTTRASGAAAEDQALAFLEAADLALLARNYRTPGRGGGEIDLIMRETDGTVVFVEVRSRASASHGGAGASISRTKQQRIIFAARHYLLRYRDMPPCRFDALLIEGGQITWLQGAFEVF